MKNQIKTAITAAMLNAEEQFNMANIDAKLYTKLKKGNAYILNSDDELGLKLYIMPVKALHNEMEDILDNTSGKVDYFYMGKDIIIGERGFIDKHLSVVKPQDYKDIMDLELGEGSIVFNV